MSYTPKKPEADGLRRYGRWAGRPAGVKEDVTKCAYEVHGSGRAPVHGQCLASRGHGPDGLYCRTHAHLVAPEAVGTLYGVTIDGEEPVLVQATVTKETANRCFLASGTTYLEPFRCQKHIDRARIGKDVFRTPRAAWGAFEDYARAKAESLAAEAFEWTKWSDLARQKQ